MKLFTLLAALLMLSSHVWAYPMGEAARFLAGMELKEDSAVALSKSPLYARHKELLDRSFAQYMTKNFVPARDFASKELSDLGHEVVFYPFGGPDILNACIFLPSAKTYILLGLEDIGGLPDLAADNPDYALKGLDAVRGSLVQIFGMNFFRVLSMRQEVGSHPYAGVAGLAMMFLSRTGYEVLSARRIELSSSGEVIDPTSENPRGLEIQFRMRGDSLVKNLYYFRGDVSDSALAKRVGLIAFIRKQTGMTTFLKAASYLMYEPYFDDMRALILNGSDAVIEDLSGIPYHYFARNERWQVALYGRYDKPIDGFKDRCQPDFARDVSLFDRPPLDFSFGYEYRTGQSHMLVARKRAGAYVPPPELDGVADHGEKTRCKGKRVQIELLP